MHEHVKQLWLQWLRDPQNKQTQSTLHSPQGYCCLGGLTEVCMRETQFAHWERVDDEMSSFRVSTSKDEAFLPARVARWAGLADAEGDVSHHSDETVTSDPALRIPPHLLERMGIRAEEIQQSGELCSALNDTWDFTFEEIAACIEFTWPTPTPVKLPVPTEEEEKQLLLV